MRSIVFLWSKSLATLAAICFIVFAGWYYDKLLNNHFDDWWFDQTIWQAQSNSTIGNIENPRGKMVHDLRQRVLKPGMPRKQVLALLGPPDAGQTRSSLSYYVGWWSGFRMDPDIFKIEFDKSDRLLKAYSYQT